MELKREDMKLEIDEDKFEEIVGGNREDNMMLALLLTMGRKGDFMDSKNNSQGNGMADIEGMKKWFAERGFRYEPGKGDEPTVFYTSEGTEIPYSFMLRLLKTGYVK